MNDCAIKVYQLLLGTTNRVQQKIYQHYTVIDLSYYTQSY